MLDYKKEPKPQSKKRAEQRVVKKKRDEAKVIAYIIVVEMPLLPLP
jgi:hypothetical protein